MSLDIPRLCWSYDEFENCAKITQGAELYARVYGPTREDALAFARLWAATPLLIHVLMEMEKRLPWHRIFPFARKTVEVALNYALGDPEPPRMAS